MSETSTAPALSDYAVELANKLAREAGVPVGQILDATARRRDVYPDAARRALAAAMPYAGPSDARRLVGLLAQDTPDYQLRALRDIAKRLDPDTPLEAWRVIADGLLRYQQRHP